MQLAGNLVPLKRPHFHLRGAQLFFLISRRPQAEFDSVDAKVWTGIDGVATIDRLQGRFPEARERIQKFWHLGAIELAEARFPANRRRILVVEPHMDDAVLSVGGTMWRRRHRCEFTVLSATGYSNFTSYYLTGRDYFDVDTVTQLRRAESALAMRLLGGRHRVLDQPDAPLRYQPGNWTRDWYARNRRSVIAFINHSATNAETETWAGALMQALASTDAEEVWVPLGVGSSVDHEGVRNACLRALTRLQGRGWQKDLFLYQDVPYAIRFPRHSIQIIEAMLAAGGSVERVGDDIGPVMPAKRRLISVFGSQFKPSYMDSQVVASARQAVSPASGFGELRYRVTALPPRMDPFDFYSGRDQVRSLSLRLGEWYPRHQTARRIRILCPRGVGRWKEDLLPLLEVFPRAVLEVHISRDALDETRRFVSPRIAIRPVDGLKRAWTLRILRLAVSRPRPLVVLTGGHLRRLRLPARAIWVFADPLLATTMDHLVQALRMRVSSDRRDRTRASLPHPAAQPVRSPDDFGPLG